jgi:alpha-L-fucosidase 2
MDDFRENARKQFGCRGIFIPALTSPETGLSTHCGSWIINWISAAGWLGQLFYDYWLFTGDEAFLEQRLLPYMKEVAEFYEDYFTINSEGQVVISPSTSPENWPREFCPLQTSEGRHPRLTVNATMDVAVARELLGNLTEQAERLGQYKESIKIWKSLLERLPSYEINEEGAMREWLDSRFSDNYEHRHLSHIYPFFPGFELCSQSCPELFKAIQYAIEKRGTVGLKDQTGWSLMHMAGIKARLGDGAGMMECFSTLAQTCVGKNFFTYHNDYRGMGVTTDWFFGRSVPFQIDANMGLTAAVYEMLVQAVPGTIKLLPALPHEVAEGRLSGLRTRAGVTVDLEWRNDPNVLMASFVSRKDQVIELHIPELYSLSAKEELELPAGQVVKRIWSKDQAVAVNAL